MDWHVFCASGHLSVACHHADVSLSTGQDVRVWPRLRVHPEKYCSFRVTVLQVKSSSSRPACRNTPDSLLYCCVYSLTTQVKRFEGLCGYALWMKTAFKKKKPHKVYVWNNHSSIGGWGPQSCQNQGRITPPPALSNLSSPDTRKWIILGE